MICGTKNETGLNGGIQPDMEQLLSVLKRYCLTLTTSSWDAEDLVQETCMRALPVVNGAQLHPNPAAYMLRIAKNLSIDQARRRLAASRALDANMQDFYTEAEPSHEIENAISLLVRHVSPLQRHVFLLREVFRYSGAEVAGILGTSEGAVKAALHRARTALDKRIQHSFSSRESDWFRDEAQQAADNDLAMAYVKAIREADPQAIIRLAQTNNGQLDMIQAVGRISGHVPTTTAAYRSGIDATCSWRTLSAAA
ncbi:RNA polymerase sigma factor [Paenibacillus nasutitermitis]|uniref:DNA-directed RNA polymerase sigma-70 factor n=1 Tax=Paenibacillus nasutitermitis TaxID=1652958 RepID=A0A916Z0D7_9BACL|nr:RNA polymerase sigma factor [Paenibacillus nasutitermitis]GGD69984.1 DNA-directed RNA polymerase sigma-70 factor [Paenibacillus nasutitermitis]